MITPTRTSFSFRVVPKFARLAITAFFMAFAYALIGTIWTIYIKSIVGRAFYVSLILSILSIISLVSYVLTISIMKRCDKSKIFKTALLSLAFLYVVLAFYKSLYGFLLISILLTLFSTLRINSFGIMVKENSSNKNISKREGLIYTFLNMAWVIGPIIAGVLLIILKANYIFIVSSFLLLLTYLIFSISRIDGNEVLEKSKTSNIKDALSFFKSKENIIAYVLGGGVNFWWILIYMFMPLYMVQQGFKEQTVGFFLFAVAMPLILLEYPFSKLIGKFKYPTLFKIGYIIPCIAAIVSFFITNNYLIFACLVAASIGMAMIEPTTESYFLRTMNKKKELKYYNIYNTTIELNFLIATLLSSVFLYFFTIKHLFLLFGISMFVFFLISFKTRKIS